MNGQIKALKLIMCELMHEPANQLTLNQLLEPQLISSNQQ
jgi:hypothetical protein